MKLSIIIPMYNAENYILRCLDSLLDQDLEKNKYEIIIINDGSIDNSFSLVNSYAVKYSNILIINQKNKGVSIARNKGVKQAKGKYIYFVDADDYIASNVLELLLFYIDNNDLDILGFNTIETEKNNLNESVNIADLKNKELKVTSGVDYISQNNYQNPIWWYLINRDFLKASKVIFLEGVFLEGSIFTAQLICKAEKIAHVPLDVYRYVNNPDSTMRSSETKHYGKLIKDFEFIALEFEKLIRKINNSSSNKEGIKRLKRKSVRLLRNFRMHGYPYKTAKSPNMFLTHLQMEHLPLK